MTKEQGLLDIEQASFLTGLPQATLRNWEKRYGFPQPKRTEGGHRLYCVQDVRDLQEVVRLHNSGARVKEAIERVVKEDNTAKKTELSSAKKSTPSGKLSEDVSQILQSLYRFDERLAEEYLSRIGLRLSESDLLEMVYPQILTQIGDDWENSRISVAQEHFSWNFCRTRLLNYFKSSHPSPYQPKIILATPEGELHEGGLIILAAAMRLRDWRVYYLGANLPLNDIKSANQIIQANVICLSAVRADQIQQKWELLNSLSCPVVIGGSCLDELKKCFVSTPQVNFAKGSFSESLSHIEFLMHAKQS